MVAREVTSKKMTLTFGLLGVISSTVGSVEGAGLGFPTSPASASKKTALKDADQLKDETLFFKKKSKNLQQFLAAEDQQYHLQKYKLHQEQEAARIFSDESERAKYEAMLREIEKEVVEKTGATNSSEEDREDEKDLELRLRLARGDYMPSGHGEMPKQNPPKPTAAERKKVVNEQWKRDHREYYHPIKTRVSNSVSWLAERFTGKKVDAPSSPEKKSVIRNPENRNASKTRRVQFQTEDFKDESGFRGVPAAGWDDQYCPSISRLTENSTLGGTYGLHPDLEGILVASGNLSEGPSEKGAQPFVSQYPLYRPFIQGGGLLRDFAPSLGPLGQLPLHWGCNAGDKQGVLIKRWDALEGRFHYCCLGGLPVSPEGATIDQSKMDKLEMENFAKFQLFALINGLHHVKEGFTNNMNFVSNKSNSRTMMGLEGALALQNRAKKDVIDPIKRVFAGAVADGRQKEWLEHLNSTPALKARLFSEYLEAAQAVERARLELQKLDDPRTYEYIIEKEGPRKRPLEVADPKYIVSSEPKDRSLVVDALFHRSSSSSNNKRRRTDATSGQKDAEPEEEQQPEEEMDADEAMDVDDHEDGQFSGLPVIIEP